MVLAREEDSLQFAAGAFDPALGERTVRARHRI
jgi:hypothetical protein